MAFSSGLYSTLGNKTSLIRTSLPLKTGFALHVQSVWLWPYLASSFGRDRLSCSSGPPSRVSGSLGQKRLRWSARLIDVDIRHHYLVPSRSEPGTGSPRRPSGPLIGAVKEMDNWDVQRRDGGTWRDRQTDGRKKDTQSAQILNVLRSELPLFSWSICCIDQWECFMFYT